MANSVPSILHFSLRRTSDKLTDRISLHWTTKVFNLKILLRSFFFLSYRLFFVFAWPSQLFAIHWSCHVASLSDGLLPTTVKSTCRLWLSDVNGTYCMYALLIQRQACFNKLVNDWTHDQEVLQDILTHSWACSRSTPRRIDVRSCSMRSSSRSTFIGKYSNTQDRKITKLNTMRQQCS